MDGGGGMFRHDSGTGPNGADLSEVSGFSAFIGIAQTLGSRPFNFARPNIDYGILEDLFPGCGKIKYPRQKACSSVI